MKRSPGNEEEETLDALFGGLLKVFQKKSGYRFSIDALLLAAFAGPQRPDRVMDLGTGCGILPLVLAFRDQAEKVVGVEIQPPLADLARRNVLLNRFCERIEIRERDFRSLEERDKEGFDWVVSNPPYRRAGSGRVNPRMEKALARHEINATLEDVLRTAHHLLKRKGRLSLIYPASRAADLIQGLRRFQLEPKTLRFVHSHAQGEARLLLVEALKGGRAQVKVYPPLFLFAAPGKYTPEAQTLFQ